MRMLREIVMAQLGVVALAGCLATEDDPAGEDPDHDVTFKVLPPIDDGGGGGGGGGPPPPPPSPTFRSSVGLGGTGPIRDLKFEKGGSSNQSPLDGYILLQADLNKGAGGTYIYLTFTRDADKVQGYNNFCGNLTPADHVTHILADDFNALTAASAKRACRGGLNLEWAEPIFEETGAGGLHDWKHPDLNDGSGGRFIFAWQSKLGGYDPITEVGVVSSGRGDVDCPAGWSRVEQELNQGAGGDWIYFCYRR